MSLTFPSNPTLGDTYTAASNTWYWDGVKWHTQGDQGIIGPSGTAGSAGNDLPKITGVTYTDNTFTSNGLSYIQSSTTGYVKLTGTNFQSSCQVYLNSTACTATRISNTQVNVTIPSSSTGYYFLYFYNPDGGTTLVANGIRFYATPSGGNITTSGSYTIHTFTSSGTFFLPSSKTVDFLVIAGGGGGGGHVSGPGGGGGGGGAGGFRSSVTHTGKNSPAESSLSLSAGSYSVTVGGGGAGGASTIGVQGSNSIFSTITSTGGGYGGSPQVNSGKGGNGGCGGGVAGVYDSSGGLGISSQGYDGANAPSGGGYTLGGGGGGGANYYGMGESNQGNHPGRGGDALSSTINGSTVYYSAGGGGGVGTTKEGTDGYGGAGGDTLNRGGDHGQNGGNGTDNTGNGGGGGGGGTGITANGATSGGNGGSGIVIIRYLT